MRRKLGLNILWFITSFLVHYFIPDGNRLWCLFVFQSPKQGLLQTRKKVSCLQFHGPFYISELNVICCESEWGHLVFIYLLDLYTTLPCATGQVTKHTTFHS